LLLDEPTNHLDIVSQEVLEAVLDGFEGTVVLVTHDRYLVDRLATQLWILEPQTKELVVFPGSWQEYVAARERESQASAADPDKEKWSPEQRRARREEQRAQRAEEARQQRVAELEAEIHRLEREMKEMEGQILAASAEQEAMRVHELSALYGDLESQLQERLELWAELAG
jgi:ATP-binding cassette subfamily F protein 3